MEMEVQSTGTLKNKAVRTSNLAKKWKFEWKVKVHIRHALAHLSKKIIYV
jgi:hypothetical protein